MPKKGPDRAGREPLFGLHSVLQVRAATARERTRTSAAGESKARDPFILLLTGAGAIREDRVVLPIPLDQHWTETRPAVLPTVAPPEAKGAESGGGFAGKPRKFADGVTEDDQGRLWREGKRLMTPQDVRASLGVGEHGLFSVPDGVELVGELPKPVAKKAARKFDPKAKQFARDLRDQWLSHVNDGGLLLTGQERYATSRQLPARRDAIALPLPEQRLLAA
jgi:hypothetical protein